MSRRLEEATEEVLLTGGRAGQRAVENAGFSEELKDKLLDRVKDAKFRETFASALAEAELSPSAGEGTRIIAAAQPWSGQETTHDAVLRMLDDSKKPLAPGLRGKFEPPPVDMRIKKDPILTPSQRVATARDRAQTYTSMGVKDKKGLSDKEREDFRNEYRERFGGARGMPNSITGLQALANERIENAISRGQFKDIPRGKGIERDTRADNPFIDTTEYILNKMIQRQAIVPPWIEKQQDIVKQVHTFRMRMRKDWKRHVARTISSRGGSLLEQMAQAEQYAASEQLHNPRIRKVEQIAVSTSSTDEPVKVTTGQIIQEAEDSIDSAAQGSSGANPEEPLPPPFRDSGWEKTEKAYMTLAVNNLNTMTRAYNLMAPDLAKKPYFSLERELTSCYADVAPEVAEEIKVRATQPKQTVRVRIAEKEATSIMDHFKGGDSPRSILESSDKPYGFKEWWADIFKKTT